MQEKIVIEREQFLALRRKNLDAHKRGELDCLCEEPFFRGATEIVVDAGDDVVCDFCNAEVLDDTLVIVNDYLACGDCQERNAI